METNTTHVTMRSIPYSTDMVDINDFFAISKLSGIFIILKLSNIPLCSAGFIPKKGLKVGASSITSVEEEQVAKVASGGLPSLAVALL